MIAKMAVRGLQRVAVDRGVERWRMFCKLPDRIKEEKDRRQKKTWGQPQLQEKVYDYVLKHSREDLVVKELREESMKRPNASMATTIDTLSVLGMFARMIQPKCVVEIGTFTGMSALLFALTIPEDGHVITIDMSDENLELAKEYWEKAGVSNKIQPRLGDGLDVLDDLESEGYKNKIDISFIDANKLGYDSYYEKLLTLTRANGIIVMDNVLWYGRVADNESDDKITCSMRALNEKLLNDQRIHFTLIPVGDGLAICQVKSTV